MIFSNKTAILGNLTEKKLITGTDENLAEFLCGLEKNLSSEEKQVFAAAAALLSEWVSSGSICITENDIETFVKTNRDDLSGTGFPTWEEIKNVMSKSSCCTQNPENENKPLVLSEDRIYFYKYWLYENSLAAKVLELSKLPGKYMEKGLPVKNVFVKLFQDPRSFEQKNAAEEVIKNRFSVITGGPGTGKTTTVAKIIAGILSIFPEERIILAAPTGKAAARMTEALHGETGKSIKGVVADEIIKKINLLEGQTIHRILGKKFGKPEKNRKNPINADLIIVDEASMIDIAVFSELLDAVSEETSLILLGDKDQLASIDAGNVLADICACRELLPEGTVSELKTSHRFDEHPGIGKLAKAVNEQKKASEIMDICKERDLGFREIKPETAKKEMEKIVADAEEKYKFLSDKSLDPKEILKKLNNFKILCPSKEDFFGVDNINRQIAEAFGKQPDTVYNGRPVMITKNDYTNNLMNGDCGVILERNRETKAYFLQGESIASFDISGLTAFETVYAMTIHKSQGSEYSSVHIVLPERDMPMLTKELLYTAVTRARQQVKITAKESVLEYTLQNRASRNSGFKEALRKAGKAL